MFYGGAKRYNPRILTRESIGYAYSFDGFHFIKYALNPVARREAEPNAASFSEVYTFFEPPLIYLFHTLRYISHPSPQFPQLEDLGIQVLATQQTFRFAMPVLRLDSLSSSATTPLEASPPIILDNISTVAVTAECAYEPNAQAGVRIHARGSIDGVQYDTSDFATLSADALPGKTASKTWTLDPKMRYFKLLIENPDPNRAVSNVQLTITLGGQ
jgi:hypothetical protein